MEEVKISVSMIVKNEKDHLRNCLESVKEADEIVIVDTGSIDNTLEIAKTYTDKVYYGEEFLWTDNFAYHRNQSAKLCSNEWILIIDADEHLESTIDEIKNKIRNSDVEGLYFKTIGNNSNQIHDSIRVYKNNGEIEWKGAAHNYLINVNKTERTNLTIKYGYSTAHKLDPDRTLRILQNECNNNPSAKRERYYLAREYFYKKQWKFCIDNLILYIKYATWNPEIADAYLMYARCLWQLQQGNEARDMCMKSIQINPDFKEALNFMAEMHYEPNKSIWKRIYKQATNTNVLFIR